MTSFFDSDENFERLLIELEGWRGTPFLNGMGRKGIGADCVRFVEAVLVNLGAIDPVTFPPYVCRGGGREMLKIFVGVLDACPKMYRLWNPRPLIIRGDVLLISSGKALHHLGIVAKPPTVWHCLRSVCEANLRDPKLEHNLYAVYRVKPAQ